MKDSPLNAFVERIMKFDMSFSGMGGAYSGIIGGTNMNTQIVENLRHDTIAFATLYVSALSKRDALVQSSEKLEGSLQALQAVNGITTETLDALIDELAALMKDKV